MSSRAERMALLAREVAIQQEMWKRECRASFLAWCIEQLAPLGQKPQRHHRLMIQKLEQVARGEIKRLMILMPPRHGKSEYSSKLFVPWYLGQGWVDRGQNLLVPRKSIIAASHTFELAVKFGRAVRNMVAMRSDVLGYGLMADASAAGRWVTTLGGEYLAAGVGKAIAGNPADLILIDDPVPDAEGAESEKIRQKTWDWYKQDLYTRLQPGGAIVLIMTRWHEEDLGGMLLQEQANGGDKWDILSLPALADSADDPLGRSAGQALWRKWVNEDDFARIRKVIGERPFYALYQQKPRPPGGSFFREADILVDGHPAPDPVRPDFLFAVLDTAIKDGKKHDGTAYTIFARTHGRNYPLQIMDWDIVQIEGASLEVWLPSLFAQLEHWCQILKPRFGSHGVWAEDKASGTILLQQGGKKPDWNLHAIESGLTAMGKDERAVAASPYISRGDVKICQAAYDKVVTFKGRTQNHFLTQMFRFVLGTEAQADDLLDCGTYGTVLSLGNREGF